MDFNERPFLVIWETTRACDLACVHCRAEAMAEPGPDELSTNEALTLIRQAAEMETPVFIFSGGDPLKRKDLPRLIGFAESCGLRTGAIPAVTPLLTKDHIRSLKESGLDQIAFSLDAATAAEHDAFRKVDGVFDRTLQCVRWANEIGLPVQINSLINVHNTQGLDELIGLVEDLDIVFWEVFFLVPTGRGRELPLLDALKFEEAFEKLYTVSLRDSFLVKVTEAPHYRRFYCEKRAAEGMPAGGSRKFSSLDPPPGLKRSQGPRGSIGHAPHGVNAGKGFVFVSRNGEVMPSGFLPLSAGNVRERHLADIYRGAPLLRELRDTSLLKGRCGACFYRELCGGSRSRAYAVTGDYLAEDPSCAYDPMLGEVREEVNKRN
ncbi:MAG: TIGR04053 family radical SAM/SPASM domain-containing protein [Candidatus Omnitrophica bacterium]|nr:TIGR04053 family radical SAM/SPASM domain-containing protein [Candidatus Omnitrophota bacterium]